MKHEVEVREISITVNGKRPCYAFTEWILIVRLLVMAGFFPEHNWFWQHGGKTNDEQEAAFQMAKESHSVIMTGQCGEVRWIGFLTSQSTIFQSYMWRHIQKRCRCAGGLKKLDLRSGSQRHRHFVGFFSVPVLAPTRDQPFYTVIPTHRQI